MSNEKNDFDKCIASCKEMDLIYSYLSSNQVSLLNIDSILRAEYVLIVSAYDFYIHQIVCRKIVDMFQYGTLTSNDKIKAEKLVSMDFFQSIVQATDMPSKKELLLAALRSKFSKDTFQSSRSIEYALGLIGIDGIWSKLSPSMGDTAINIKNTLDIIIHRRNQIAHEADIDVSTVSYRPISEADVGACRDFIEKIVVCIDALL